MKATAPILASIVAASMLLLGAPTASAEVDPDPVCQEIYYGLEQFLIVCVDNDASCAVQVITHAGSTCYGVTTTSAVREYCQPLANDLEYEYGVCVGTGLPGCHVWYYRYPGTQVCIVP